MADQCIVCLEVLDVAPVASASGLPLEVAPPAATAIATATASDLPTASSAAKPENHDNVAQIKVCGHMLHDSCLREWTEKANSCPICRQTFNSVQVYDKVNGNLVSSYTVEDKKQVAEFDSQAWLDENPEDQADVQIPCPVCNRADNEEILLLCDGCDTPYHTYCIGLDSVPPGNWFCMECVDALGPEVMEQRNGPHGNRRYYFPRTQASMRRARRGAQSDEWQGAWGRIAGRIWDALSLDLDYQDEDEEDRDIFEGLRRSQQLREQERREHERWQQRLNIASRLGARDVFASHIPAGVFQSRISPVNVATQPSREEQRAWGALERARDLENSTASTSRKRKSRSATAEPAEPQQEPERKLKRPRTRRLPTQNGESSSSVKPQSNPADDAGPSRPTNTSASTTAPSSTSGADSAPAPSFLSSLLKEVEMSTPSDEENLRNLFGPIPGANDRSSPARSPSPSNYGSPRSHMITPPPNHSARPSSPHMTLSSHIAPVYPPANFSPTRSSSPSKKESRSSSPNQRQRPLVTTANESRSSPENSDSEHHPPRGRRREAGSAGGASVSTSPHPISDLAHPSPRRAHPVVLPPRASKSQEASPTSGNPLPLEVKEKISKIVRGALNPHWKSKQLTADQYATINQNVSRKIYEEVKNYSPKEGLGEEMKQQWEKIATQEVAQMVAELKG